MLVGITHLLLVAGLSFQVLRFPDFVSDGNIKQRRPLGVKHCNGDRSEILAGRLLNSSSVCCSISEGGSQGGGGDQRAPVWVGNSRSRAGWCPTFALEVLLSLRCNG